MTQFSVCLFPVKGFIFCSCSFNDLGKVINTKPFPCNINRVQSINQSCESNGTTGRNGKNKSATPTTKILTCSSTIGFANAWKSTFYTTDESKIWSLAYFRTNIIWNASILSTILLMSSPISLHLSIHNVSLLTIVNHLLHTDPVWRRSSGSKYLKTLSQNLSGKSWKAVSSTPPERK